MFHRQLCWNILFLYPRVNILPVQDNFNAWIRKHKQQFIPKTLLQSPFVSTALPPTFFVSFSFLFTDISFSHYFPKVTEKLSLFPLYPSCFLLTSRKTFLTFFFFLILSTSFNLSYGFPKQPKSLLNG